MNLKHRERSQSLRPVVFSLLAMLSHSCSGSPEVAALGPQKHETLTWDPPGTLAAVAGMVPSGPEPRPAESQLFCLLPRG